MGLPRKLNICGKNYKVTYVNRHIDVDPSGEELLWGQVDYRRRQIRVYNGEDGPDTYDTLIHEMIHAMLREHAMIMTVVGEAEEPFVNDVASAITDCLFRNKLIKEAHEV